MRTCSTCGEELAGQQKKYCSTTCRDEALRTNTACTCLHCGKVFYVKPWELRRGRGSYCGPECYRASRKGREVPARRRRQSRVCPVCGKEYEVGGRAGKREQEVCSRSCANRARYRTGAHANELIIADAAYLAGLIDGEGSIMILPRGTSISVKLTIANTYLPALEWVRQITGVGAVNDSRPATDRHRAGYIFHVNSEAAESILRQVRPYLRIKHEQADICIDAQERLREPALKADRTWQNEYCERVRALNQRGPRVPT